MNADRFDFVEVPSESPSHEPLTGHDRLSSDRYHGSLLLELTALTPISISAGITARGSDVGVSVPLIRVMGQNSNGKPILQGTSLKGCIRAVYETITNSRLGVKGAVDLPERAPLSGKRGASVSPAELVFGAMGFQGSISIADAVGDRPLEVGYLTPAFQPRSGNGRKFYRHQNSISVNPVGQPPSDQTPSPIQQAPTGTVFSTTLHFSNLTSAQLGALLIALGLDSKYPFALKLGAGKGKGLGSVVVRLANHAIIKGDTLKEARYLEYKPSKNDKPSKKSIPKDLLKEAIQAAHANLIHAKQLSRLHSILQRPATL